MKAEPIQTDDRQILIFGQRTVRYNACRRRPDAQSLSFRRDSVGERHVEAVQFNARVKVMLQLIDNACAQKGFGVMDQVSRGADERSERQQASPTYPGDPAMSTPE